MEGFIISGCLFGRHLCRYWTDRGERYRQCTRCERIWRRVRYDMVIAWVREGKADDREV